MLSFFADVFLLEQVSLRTSPEIAPLIYRRRWFPAFAVLAVALIAGSVWFTGRWVRQSTSPANSSRLSTQASPADVGANFESGAPDSSGKNENDENQAWLVTQATDHSLTLLANQAALYDTKFSMVNGEHAISNWKTGSKAVWNIQVDKVRSGFFYLEVKYQCESQSALEIFLDNHSIGMMTLYPNSKDSGYSDALDENHFQVEEKIIRIASESKYQFKLQLIDFSVASDSKNDPRTPGLSIISVELKPRK